MRKANVAIIGPGNIGIDLMIKIEQLSRHLRCAALVGRNRASEGLKRARSLGIATSHEGLDGLRALPGYGDIEIVFDATSAGAHRRHSEALIGDGKRVIDLTPAAIGPFCVPSVDLDGHLDAPNINMVTCGGQAAIPMIAAVSRVTPVHWAELLACIAAKSAGPGTLANIDAFIETTGRAIEQIGRARRGRAAIVLDPTEPPTAMRDRIVCLCEDADRQAIRASIARMVAAVRSYVPGYRLEGAVLLEPTGLGAPLRMAGVDAAFTGLKVTIHLEVQGAAHYLPAYAGNLDIMTSAALGTAEALIEHATQGVAA
jgi:acetaldehyde dehydrogenase